MKILFLRPILGTLKGMISLNEKYQLDFNVPHLLARVLGFRETDEPVSNMIFEVKDVVNINQTNSLLVWCNLVRPNYLNGR